MYDSLLLMMSFMKEAELGYLGYRQDSIPVNAQFVITKSINTRKVNNNFCNVQQL